MKGFVDTIVDVSVVAMVWTISSTENFSATLKLFTSAIVFILAVARLYYFIKDRSLKDEKDSKAK